MTGRLPPARFSEMNGGIWDWRNPAISSRASFLPGSANSDARSLRLNFELNVESYGRDSADEMGQIIAGKLRGAHGVTLPEGDGRNYPAKLRDSIARLFSHACSSLRLPGRDRVSGNFRGP
jgi:phosphatidylserine/phosphatidylglycerophosphate/cardiolipin synthase-like enzyme